jgi:hypothetical protein
MVRRCLASLASLFVTATVCYMMRHERPHGADWVVAGPMLAVPAIAAALIWSRRITAQLAARGIWWAFVLGGGLLSVGAPPTELRQMGCAMVAGAAGALLAAGGGGLREGGGAFRPVAFRGTLTLSLVLAIADAGTLLWVGLLALMANRMPWFLLLVPFMAAGVIGLLRLRTWGLILSLVCNLLVAILAATRVLALPDPLRGLYVSTATLQLVVPLPMLITLVRRRAPGPDRWQRARPAAATVALLGIAGLCLYAGLIHQGALLGF